jgi:hypothetical protein
MKNDKDATYTAFNDKLRDNMYIKQAKFTTALQQAPKNAFERDQIVNNALDELITISDAELRKPKCTDGLANSISNGVQEQCREYNTQLTVEDLSKIVVTLNMYNYYSRITDPNDREEALKYVFDSADLMRQNLPEAKSLEYAHYLCRYTTSIPQDDPFLRYNRHPVFYVDPRVVKPAVMNSANAVMNELNNLASVMYPEESYKAVQKSMIVLFMTQLGLPLLIYIVYKAIKARMQKNGS